MKMSAGLSRVKWSRLAAVSVIAVICGAIAIAVSYQAAVAQAQPQPQPPIGGPPGFMPFAPMGPPPGGGGIAILAYKERIYVAQDGVLYKIDPEKMTVEGEVRYLKPMPPLVPGPGAPGQPR